MNITDYIRYALKSTTDKGVNEKTIIQQLNKINIHLEDTKKVTERNMMYLNFLSAFIFFLRSCTFDSAGHWIHNGTRLFFPHEPQGEDSVPRKNAKMREP